MPLRVVLDANVLYPFSLRDTLLRAGEVGLIQIYWSDEILDEAVRNLIADGRVTEDKANSLRSTMERAFPEAMVTDYEDLVASMPNAEEDRHVAAVAVKANATRIVTMNLKDFRVLPDDIEACGPDSLLVDLLASEPDQVVSLLRDQAADLSRPSRTLDELLSGLAKMVPKFIKAVREQIAGDQDSEGSG